MSDELPLGWVWAKMLDVLDYEGGSQPPKKDFVYEPRDGYVRLIQIRDFGDKPFPTYVPDSGRLKKANKDDLLLARYGGSSANDSLGRICTGLEGAYNVALAKIIFDREHMDKNYVRYLFMGPWFREKVSQNSRSCQTGFNREDVEDIEFPIAPSAEQRRIVAKLENIFGQLDSCQQRLVKMPTLLKRFRQSILAAACSGRLTADWREENPAESVSEAARKVLLDDDAKSDLYDIPDSWVWTKLDRVCLKITDGEHLTPPVTEKGVPLLSAKDVRDNYLDFSDTKFVSEEFAKKSRQRCNPEQGDILVVSRGATVGRTCRVQVPDVFCLMGSVLLFKPDVRYIAPQLIEFCFKSPSGLAALIATSSSTAQQAIYIKDMRSFALPVPPPAEQQEIVRRVEGLFALADQLEQRLAQARKQVDKLTPSLLARAFAGKLVSQNPADEPAEMLLRQLSRQGLHRHPRGTFHA